MTTQTAPSPPSQTVARSRVHLDVSRIALLVANLGLLLLVFHQYQMETPLFRQILLLGLGGFAVHALLPLAYRLWFFVGLSLAGIVLAFGFADGLWLVTAGMVLVGVCHLPLAFSTRVVLLLVVGGALAAARGGALSVPWSASVWPILASMFMFRLALYLHALKHEKERPDLARTLSYFFMLPNVAYPFFPVVDYSTFRRAYFDREALAIYERGVVWMARGVLHLLLYRLVYMHVVIDAGDVLNLGDLVRFLLGTLLLYLRVSGQFHLIIGVLHLFGFRLPETNHNYFLASSFSDLWRRINIYWKDFMMKLVYYPSFFRFRKWGTTRAMVLATLVVFLVTWVLHSYQWFWLRGSFPLTVQDALFWGILCVFVILNVLREARGGTNRSRLRRDWSLSRGLATVGTFTVFCVLWSLWSAESFVGWLWMWSAAGRAEPLHLVLLAGLVGAGVAIGGRPWGVARLEAAASPTATLPPHAVRWATVTLVVVAVLAQPPVRSVAPAGASTVLASLLSPGLNVRDANLQHRGYYEKLDLRGQLNSELWEVVGTRAEEWQNLEEVGALRSREDLMLVELLPDLNLPWNDAFFTTNAWGMRDRPYEREKPEGTTRIALVGPSIAMGNNISDEDTFENLLEDRLSREPIPHLGEKVEILNFSVDGYTFPQQLEAIRMKVGAFEPDIVIVSDGERTRYSTEFYLQRLVVRGVPVEDPELREMMEEAGVLGAEVSDGVPVPWAWGRSLVGRVAGVPTRMPWAELTGRLNGFGERVASWAIGEIGREVRAMGATPVFLGLSVVGPAPDTRIFTLDVARSEGFVVLDLFDVFDGMDHDELRVAPWDDHPNALAHQLIADRLYDEIRARESLHLPSPSIH